MPIVKFIRKNFSISSGVIFLAFLVGLGLLSATWKINFWPTDAEVYYFDPAIKLPHLQYLSQIHAGMDQEKVRWLHGKEILILFISIMQHLMNDFVTLRPFMLLGIISICASAVFIFFIARRLWGQAVGLLCYFVFLTSFWPYLYVLFAKHQPLGLCFALLAILFLLCSSSRIGLRILNYLFAGVCLGLSMHSSTSAGLYLGFFVAAFFYNTLTDQGTTPRSQVPWARILLAGSLIVLGLGLVVLWVNWPDVLGNIKGYIEYINISSTHSHFFYNQPFLQQWFPEKHVGDVRGGWLWILKYFLLIMPVLFPVYLASAGFLVLRCWLNMSKSVILTTLGVIFLSLTPLLMAETAHVAQYGGNYFPSLIGLIFLVGYVSAVLSREGLLTIIPSSYRWLTKLLLGLVVLGQVMANGVIFFTDVYPTRMATTFLSRKIEQLGITRLATYKGNRHRQNFTVCLDPDVLRKLNFIPIRSIAEAKTGFVLIPPITGDSIYIAMISDYADFDNDIFLNELRRKGNLHDYAAASYRTLVNSRIWLHEEEILSYRYLILNDKFTRDEDAGRVWLLDAGKFAADLKRNLPDPEYVKLLRSGLRNIGTKSKIYLCNGYMLKIKEPMPLNRVFTRLYKIGQPGDSLLAYIYQVDLDQPVWVPAGGNFFSVPLQAQLVPNSNETRPAVFQFSPPVFLSPGLYNLRIYRTGQPDDKNYYQIINKNSAIILR